MLTAIELQDMVRSKVGGGKFAGVYNGIRQDALGVQRERKIARTLQHHKSRSCGETEDSKKCVKEGGAVRGRMRKGREKRMREA